MKITVSESMAHLEGEWTLKGLSNVTIDSLAGALRQVESKGADTLRIDCQQVTAIDGIGLMILDGLLCIPRLHGHRTELCRLPDELRQSFQSSGFCFSCTDAFPLQ